MIDSKFKIIGDRRKIQAQAKIGTILLQMYKSGITKIVGLDRIRKQVGMKYSHYNRYIPFLITNGESGSKAIQLEKEDLEIIEDTIHFYNEIISLTERKKMIHRLVYTALTLKNE